MIRAGLAIGLAVGGWVQQASACILLPYERPYWLTILQSDPTTQTEQCAFVNAGIDDNESGGDAFDLGNGRIAQLMNGHDYMALIVDCNASEATMLRGDVLPDRSISVCITDHDIFEPVVGADADLSLSAGESLAELVNLAAAVGWLASDPEWSLNTYPWDERDAQGQRINAPVWPRDRVDLLCGCRIFYPDSPGAQQ